MEVILLPGLDGTGKLFSPLLKALPASVKVRVIDYPTQEIISYANLIDYVIERLPTDHDFMLVGESFSGPLAYMIAQRNLSHLKALIFVASFLHSPRPFLLRVFCLLPISFLISMPSPRFLLRLVTLGPGSDRQMQTDVYQTVKSVNPKVLASRFQEINKLRLKPAKLPMQIAYLQAAHDRVVPARNLKPFHQLSDALKCYKVSGSHMIMQTAAEDCAKVIVSELQRYENKGMP